jgi:hypothetical protein
MTIPDAVFADARVQKATYSHGSIGCPVARDGTIREEGRHYHAYVGQGLRPDVSRNCFAFSVDVDLKGVFTVTGCDAEAASRMILALAQYAAELQAKSGRIVPETE